jgi:hypothetical protein
MQKRGKYRNKDMAYWLKLIGTVDDPVEEYSLPYVWYSARGYDYIVNGDKIVLYATLSGMVFASANVISEPEPSGHERWPFSVNVEYRQSPLLVADGVPVNDIADPGNNLLLELQHQSFIPITEDEFNQAETLLAVRA